MKWNNSSTLSTLLGFSHIFMFHCQEIAASFSGGGVRGYENGPAFVPGEICRIFRSAGEKLLHHVGICSFMPIFWLQGARILFQFSCQLSH